MCTPFSINPPESNGVLPSGKKSKKLEKKKVIEIEFERQLNGWDVTDIWFVIYGTFSFKIVLIHIPVHQWPCKNKMTNIFQKDNYYQEFSYVQNFNQSMSIYVMGPKDF